MKTPREVLFERHWATRPKLDAIRQQVVAELNNKGTKEQRSDKVFVSLLLGCSKNIWCELIFPSHRIWAGLAAIWLLLLVVNFSMRDHSQATMAKASTSAEMAATFQQQQELLAELIGPNEPVVAEPQKGYVPRPSSWRPFEIITT
jgi:hypothetical protein